MGERAKGRERDLPDSVKEHFWKPPKPISILFSSVVKGAQKVKGIAALREKGEERIPLVRMDSLCAAIHAIVRTI